MFDDARREGVDLDAVDVRRPDGTRVTNEDLEVILEDARDEVDALAADGVITRAPRHGRRRR